MKKLGLAVLLSVLVVSLGFAQVMPPKSPGWFNHTGRWSFGVQGGGNMWINDFDTQTFTGGGNGFIRYSFARDFSLGLMGGWDELASKEPSIMAGRMSLQNTSLKAKGYSGDLVAWFHLNAGKPVAPYIYMGVGMFSYKRTILDDQGWPNSDNQTSIHIPVGVGLEFAFSKNVALSLDLGARVMDHWTDYYKAGTQNFMGTDWYPTGRLGVNFYFGDSDDDDNDGDMLTNGYEKSIGTALNKADTDGDGLNDYEELAKYTTDPKTEDTDGDGLNDGEEAITFHTSPLKADSDGDGLKDGDEIKKHRTDPLKADTDADGLSDGDEVLKHKTSPTKADTDGGSVNDAQEIAKGINPLDPTDDIPKPAIQRIEVGKAIVLEGIVFKTGKSTIEPSSEINLMDAFNTLKDNPAIAVEIRGYTDNVGKIASNKKLSLRRAEAVRSWLVMKGIDSRRIAVAGFGPENPIGDNSTPEGRAQNRRIEFFRTK